ncbi:hypothetical protein [Flammeovirga kamogawensis]|uniref:Alpha/beta hydrolase n=1 Tax=Flammeovirga kamogawensis TaxID=373891 RepID=A0ABX8H2E4_9BACT|nr:hypothetical protein [Flammeovirga kamogawensis]MBB6460270.1 pimeloyl-ACP methyl ester carboxylesterase [Flammeovirga kamogawensis]QWG10081.1 hypothetical protein KM029_20580 [Flammeovirga kamogawensis]TRX65588.1 hypothetical protein EO216_24010 [Flammeovirga kamogawensis]
MHNKLHLTYLILLLSLNSFSQESYKLYDKVTVINLESSIEADSINFIVVDTDITQKKPVFLFCQGSLPLPMFMGIKGTDSPFFFGGGISNFNFNAITQKYHLVVISMPHTPIFVDSTHLSPYGNFYIPDPKQPQQILKEFTEADYLNNYVDRGIRVLDFLKKQPWVDTSKCVVFGHSQGSKVATKLAIQNKDISHIGLSGANPFGRVDQFIRIAKQDARNNKITWKEAEKRINLNYKYYEDSFNPDSLKVNSYLKGYNSFSEPLFDDWLALNIPIFLTYGTEDNAAELCDIMPLFFIEQGKDNLTVKRWANCDHNYFLLDENKQPDYKKGHWDDVITTFLQHIEQPPLN